MKPIPWAVSEFPTVCALPGNTPPQTTIDPPPPMQAIAIIITQQSNTQQQHIFILYINGRM